MPIILPTKSIYFNDVNLIAQIGKVRSRKDVPEEKWRIIVSGMPAIVGKTFAQEAVKCGLSIFLNRFCPVSEQIDVYNSLEIKDRAYLSCGLNWSKEELKELASVSCNNYIVDFAHGGLPQIKERLEFIKNYLPIENLIIGNVHTRQGIHYLEDIANEVFPDIKSLIIRVNIGSGAGCSSSDTTGFNRGSITEIIECSEAIQNENTYIAEDGGLKKPEYVCKAFLCGSDMVIMGSYWRQCLEAETNINGDGTFWGCASDKNQEKWKGHKFRHSEGKVLPKEDTELKPLKEVVNELWGCIASAVSYSGYSTLSEAIGNGVFEKKQNSLQPKKRA